MATITFQPVPQRFQPGRITFAPGLRTLPLWIVMAYLGLLFGLFLIWPINWQIFHASGWRMLISYVLLCYAVIVFSFYAGARPVTQVAAPFLRVDYIIVAGALVAFALLFPLSLVYTGRWPWQVYEVLGDQGGAYRTLQQQLEETAGQRSGVAFLRALFAPLTFAVVPLGLIHWNRLGWIPRAFVGLSVATTIVFSLLRGTDREFVELFIVGTSAMLVAVARANAPGELWVRTLAKRYWHVLVIGVIFLFVASSLFTQRKSERLGNIENRTAVCANASPICADIDAPWIAWMPLSQRFATSIFILSSASGFYGLEIAMEKDFQSSYGVGHSPAALNVYEILTNDDSLRRRTYTYRNSFEGWSDQNYWSTLIAWIANDVGFVGAVFVLSLFAFLWSRAWRSATLGVSDSGAIIFCAMMIMFIYLPANNQLLGTYDGYVMLLTWLFIWIRERRIPIRAAGTE